MDIINQIEQLRYDIENGVETDVINISARLIQIKAQALQLRQCAVSGSLLKDWQMWEDCILSFLRSHRGLRAKFHEHVDEWNTHTKLPPSAYEREEQ